MASVDLNDKNLTNITNEKNTALNTTNAAYDSIINSTDKYYQNQIDASKDWANKQTELQQAQTDFAIEKIEQQKQEAEKDYTKEQQGAYQDYMKQNNAYGSSKQATGQAGLAGSGWSETVQAGYYNTYQNRYATAKETYNKAVLNYNNSIKDAQLQNNSTLAQIAYEAQQTQLQLATQNMQYKNEMLQKKTEAQLSIANQYNSQWQTMYNTLLENAQFNEQLAQTKAQFEETKRQNQAQLELQKAQLAETIRSNKANEVLTREGNNPYTEPKQTYEVNTAYYQGDLSDDAKTYGTFSNGYQPKGISGHGTVSKSGDTYTFQTQTLSGQKQTVTQNVWKAADGTKWYWDGRQNDYVRFPGTTKKTANSVTTAYKNGVGGGSR